MSFDQNYLRVKVTFIEEVLGMMPANKNIYTDFIASKAPDAMTREEEVEVFGANEIELQEMTVFPRDAEGRPYFYDYQIKGMFKDVCGMLRRVPGSKSSKIKAYKKEIDGLIFVTDRENPIIFNGEITTNQRPLRASTPQGERIALASSESIPAGATMEFEIAMLNADAHKDLIIEWLDYGKLRGLGQWRNSGTGRFTYEII